VICGTSNVTLEVSNLSPASPTGGYNYNWSQDGGTTFSVTAGSNQLTTNTTGDYVLKVTDLSSGCFGISSPLTVGSGIAPNATISGTTSYCEGLSTTLTTSNDVNYSYNWTIPGGAILSLTYEQTANVQGYYSVEIVDNSNGCSSTSALTYVTRNAKPQVQITTTKTILCESNNNINSQAENTTLTATSGYTQYDWNILGTQNANSISVHSSSILNSSQTVNVEVTDFNGCKNSQNILLIKESAPSLNITTGHVSICSPDPTTLTANATGGAGITYTYLWKNAAGTSIGTGSQVSVSGVSGNTYAYSVEAISGSGSGCRTESTTTLTAYSKPGVTINGSTTLCAGEMNVLQSVIAPGVPVVPTTGYTYEWTTPGITTVANTPDLQITQGGQYTLKVTDPTSQCSNTATKTVQEFAQATMAITGPTRVCVGDVVTLTATPSNAQTANYLYTISHDNNVVWTTSNQYVFTATATSGGVYEANGVHTNTCITTPVSHTITVASAPNVTVGSSGLNANGQAYTTANLCLENGTVFNNVSLSSNVSGTSSNYTYQWYNGAASSIANATSNIYNPTVGGTYFVRVTNADGCYTESTPLNITASVVHAVSITGDLTPCTNSNPQLNGLQAIATPPGTNYSYQWKINGSNANQLSNQEFVFSAGYVNSPPPVSTGLNTYTVRVSDPNTGCWVDESEVVTYVDPPSISITGPSTLCAGGTVILTAGGASPLTYEWYFKNPNSTSPAFVALPAPKFTAQSVSVSDAGEYKLKVTDPNSSCKNEDILTLALISSVGVTIAPTNANTQTICLPNGTVSLTGTVAVPGVYTYTWYKDGGTVVAGPSQNQLTYIANTTGNYHLEVFNASTGCTEISNVFAVNSESVPTVVLGGPTTICGTGNIVVTSSVNSSPSNPDYYYEWYRDNLPLTTATAQSVSNLSTNQAGSYVVKAISKTSGCSASSQSWVVSLGAGSTVNLTANSSQYCSTGNVTITANPTNTGLYDFTWSSSLGTDPGVPNTPQTALSTGSITVSTPDTYFVTVTNNTTGCTSNNSIVVSPANINATVSFNPDSIICDGESTAINVVPSTAGLYNVRLYQGIVDPSALVQAKLGVQNASFLNITNSGTYFAVIESANNVSCGVTKTVNITAGSTTPFTLTPSKQVLCTGESTTITAIPNIPGNYLYEWQNSSGVVIGTSSVLSVSIGGDYTLKLTNNQGCTSEDDITVVTDNQLQVTVTNVDPTAPPYLCAANGTTLTADVIPNDPTQTYLWEWIKDTTYAVGFNQTLTVLDSGIYHVEVVNENGCRYESTRIYVEDRRPVVSYVSSHPNNTVCAGQDLELNFSATPSSSFDFYNTLFDPVATGNPYVKNNRITNCNTCVISTAVTGNGGGTYILQATSGNGCVTEEIITVTVNELPSFTVTTPLEYCQFGASDQLFIETEFTNFTGTATGASQGSYAPRWYSAPDTSSFMGNSPRPSTDSVGTHRYYVQVENTTTGCLSTYDFVDVEVLQSPAQPTLTSPLVACENASRIPAVSNLNDVNSDYNILKTITLASNVNALSAAQGSGNYRSVWYEADTATEIDLSVSQNKIIPNLSIPDTLLYFVSQFSIVGSNGCPSKKLAVPVYVAAKPSFTVLSENGQFSVCRNDSLELSIQTPVNSTTYEWIKGASTPSIPTTPLTYSTNAQLGTNYLAHSNNSNPEVYWVRAVDSNQCFMQKSVTVNQIALPANNTGYAPTSLNYCFGADAQELQVSTEVGSLTALWYVNTTNAFLGDSIVPNTLVAPSTSIGTSFTTTTYKFKLKNQMTGCVSEFFRTVDVNIHQLPDAPIITRDWTECFNTDMANVAPLSSTLLTTTGLTTKWYDADTNLLSGGSYRPSSLRTDTAVYYVSSIGGGTMYCESNFSEVLAYTLALPQPILSYSDPDGLICYGEEFEVFVLPDSTNANWDFTWRNISTGVPFTEQQDGSYFARNILKYESFELLIEDDRTCQNFMYFDVDVYPEIIPPGSFINLYCYNQDSIRLSANYPQNTIPAGYKLTWLDSNHNRLAIAPFAPTWIQPSNSNFIDIPYLIEYKDTIKGCYSEEVGVAARINALPPDPILLRDWATCYGEPNPIAINGNPLRPQIAVVGSNNFKWIGPDSASILNSAPIPSTLRNDTVHYFVRTVSNINNCESANMVAIKAYTFPLPQPIVAVSDSDRIVCRGEAIEFEVTDTSTNGWTYQWTKFDARVSPPIPAVPAAPGLGLLYQDSVTYNTQYELRTTDTNSCFSKNIWNITKADYPIVDSIIVKDITCYNMDDGEITIFSRFGQSLRYSLDSGATYTFRAKDTALEKGWYYVDVADNFSNCPTIYQVNDRHVYVHEPLPLKIDTVITQDITCFGLLDGQMQIVASGGYILDSTLFNYLKPEKLYSIDAGATLYLNDSLPGSTSSGMINLAAGLYQIRVENVNGCKAINNQNYMITLKQPDLAYIDTIIVTPISCYNQTDGTIDVRAFGGNSLTYSIDSVQYFPTGLFNNLGSQAYFLEVVDSLGCLITPNSQSDSIWISEPAPLTVNPIVNQLLCYHDSTGLIELNIIGGNPNFQSYQYGYDIDWDVDTASLTMPINSSYYLPNNDSIYGLIAGTYYANIVDFKGCGIVVPIVVNEPDPVEVNSITIVPVSCYGFGDGRILVNATGGNYLEYELTTSLGVPTPSWQANPLFTLLDSDTTFVTVRDSNACLVTYNTVTKNFVPQPDSAFVDTIITHDILCFSDSTGSIFIKAFGGNSLTYSIDSVFTGTTFYPGLVADTFYVQVVDSKSCPVNYMNNDSIIILTEPPLLVLESNLVRGVTCYYDTTGQIGHLITGGVLPHTLVLNDLDTLTSTTLTTNLYGGPWYFTSYDANGCRDSSLVYIPTTDYDCDSIPDNIEGDTDFDFDGIPNMMDFDSDGDGIPDIVERDYNRDGIIYDDCDNDGWPDYLDTDQCNFFIPNILTPNGDGDNDFFVIPELDKYPNNQLSIYDRLGNLVFQQTSYVNTFDGSANRSSALSTTNSQLPIDTYFYIVEVNGVPFQSGYIFIMR